MQVKVFEIGTARKEADELWGMDGVGKGGLCDVKRGKVKWVDEFWGGETGSDYLHGYMPECVCSAREEDIVVVVIVVVALVVKGSLEADAEVVKDAARCGEGEIGESGVGGASLERDRAIHPARQVGEEAGHDWQEVLKVCEFDMDAEGERG